MADEATPTWAPPENIEALFAASAGSKFASINKPTAGARSEKELTVGDAPVQLYSLGTPNGHKVSIMLEELGIDYDAHVINIMNGDQFGSGFVGANPNSKIPAIVDKEGPDGKPINVWESASIILYLAEKHGKFIPKNPRDRQEVLNWLFWQMAGQGPMAGNFGHFMVYAPADQLQARNYGVSRYGMETQRLCSVLDQALAGKTYLVGEEYSIADIACFPWFNQLRKGYVHSTGIGANQFLSVEKNYPNAVAWANRILERPAVVKGLQVCSFSGVGKPWLTSKV
jgi:GST-like protein